MDNVTLTGNNNVVNGVIGSAATPSANTLTPLDKIAGTGTGNVLNIADVNVTTTGTAMPAGISVSGVQTVNLTAAAGTGTGNFSGFTGLTALNVTEAGGAAGITAAGTTAVTLTDSALDTGAAGAGVTRTSITVNGGSNVSVTANGVVGNTSAFSTGAAGQAGQISVGQTTQATGTVSVTENMASTATGAAIADAINVKGGTTVILLGGAYVVFALASMTGASRAHRRTMPDVSYGMYLYGWPVQKLLSWYIPHMSPWLMFFLSLAISVGFGWLSWTYIERPALNKKPRQPVANPDEMEMADAV